MDESDWSIAASHSAGERAEADAEAVVEPDDEVKVVDAPGTLFDAAAVSEALP
jgi:hypothetical protein